MTTILETHGLTKHFGGLRVLNGVDFRVRHGEVHAIIGPNGAGKTTFFNLISGRLRPSAGRVTFEGDDIAGLPPHAISRRGIGRTLQVSSLFGGMTVRETLWIAAQSRERLWPLSSPRKYPAVSARVAKLLSTFHLEDQSDRLAAELSHGDQRLLEIGVALATEPRLLLLDEPTAGMSRVEASRTVDLIRELAETLTILLVEHDMKLVMEVADRITVLDKGTLIAEGSPREIRASELVQNVYLGRATSNEHARAQ